MFDYILNELSVPPYPDKHIAHDRLTRFVNTCAEAQRMGFGTLRIPFEMGDNLYSVFIAPNYPISQWIEEYKHEEVVERFKLLVTQSPFIVGDEVEEKEQFEGSEYHVVHNGQKGENAKGLGVAHLLNTLAVSFSCRLEDCSCWNNSTITLNRFYFDESANSQEEIVTVIHASNPEHLATHLEWLEAEQKAQADKCKEIWENRTTLFPSLIFCGETEKQLAKGGITGISRLYDKLKRLNEYAENWIEAGFSTSDVEVFGLKVSNDSKATMQNPRLKNQRRFRLPNGRKIFFESHIKAGDIRFHFYADEATHIVYVGYIGRHLPTVKFK